MFGGADEIQPRTFVPRRSCAPRSRSRRIVWIDGCYDLTHFGHFNAFRQAPTTPHHHRQLTHSLPPIWCVSLLLVIMVL